MKSENIDTTGNIDQKAGEKGCGDTQDTASQRSFSGLEMLSKQ